MKTRKSTPALTVQQRRRQIIDLLAGHLARMPEAIDVPPPKADLVFESGEESATMNCSKDSGISLELSAN
jgi:hypothetical protein